MRKSRSTVKSKGSEYKGLYVFYRSKEGSILIQTKITFSTGCCKTQLLDDCFCVWPTSTDQNTSFFRTIRNIQTVKF